MKLGNENIAENSSISENNIYIEHYSDEEEYPNVNRISNSREYKIQQKKKINNYLICCIKSITIFIINILVMPIGITEIYYAFTDVSCVHTKTNILDIELYTYLIVDGFYGLIVTFLVSLYIYSCLNIEKIDLHSINYKIINFISNTLALFNLSWTIVGAILFWNKKNNYKCNSNIYCFVFIALVIKLIFQFIYIIRCTNKN